MVIKNFPLKYNLLGIDKVIFPKESLCFNINEVELVDRQKLPWFTPLKKLAQQGEHHCLGGEGINLLMSMLQNQLISYGSILLPVFLHLNKI